MNYIAKNTSLQLATQDEQTELCNNRYLAPYKRIVVFPFSAWKYTF